MKEKGSAIYQLFLFALTFYVLTLLIIEEFWITDPEIKQVLQYIDFFICLVFLSDFFVNLFYAKSKLAYLKWGWIDLVASIPAVDTLRWGRISRIVRIIRVLRAVKSVKFLYSTIQKSKFQSLTLLVLLITLISFSICSSLILEFETGQSSTLNTAQDALWWSFLNIMNAKVSINTAQSSEGIFLTIVLNKIGLLLFAYFNAMLVAWLIQKRKHKILSY